MLVNCSGLQLAFFIRKGCTTVIALEQDTGSLTKIVFQIEVKKDFVMIFSMKLAQPNAVGIFGQ